MTQSLVTCDAGFGLSNSWVPTCSGGRVSTAPTVMRAAYRKGVISAMAELGGAKVIATIVTGGNIDTARFCELINQYSKTKG